MTDIVLALRRAAKLPKSMVAVSIALNSAANEIERLRGVIISAAEVLEEHADYTDDGGSGLLAKKLRSGLDR